MYVQEHRLTLDLSFYGLVDGNSDVGSQAKLEEIGFTQELFIIGVVVENSFASFIYSIIITWCNIELDGNILLQYIILSFRKV